MRGGVYGALLFLINAVIGLFLLRCTSRLAGRECRMWRMALGGALAGTASLALLLPQLPPVLLWVLKAAEACIIVLAGFLVCSFGLQKGLERISKWMMLALLVLTALLYYHPSRRIESARA